jgi:hypothetical protein
LIGLCCWGDVADCFSLSPKFVTVHRDQRIERFQKERDAVLAFLGVLRECFECDIHYLEGNHEYRLERYLKQKGPSLLGLEEVTIPALLQLERFEMWHVPYGDVLSFAGESVSYTHGTHIRKFGGYTARAHVERIGRSVVHGHSHRGGSTYYSTAAGTVAAWENFCACRFDMPYVESAPDWQHGFSVVSAGKTAHSVEQVYIPPKGNPLFRGMSLSRNGWQGVLKPVWRVK